MHPDTSDLIYDWNIRRRRHRLTDGVLSLHDETLRDGLQSPSAIDPPIGVKQRLLAMSDALGVHSSNIGLPGAGARAKAHCAALAATIRDERLSIRATAAARTHRGDIEPIADIVQKTGVPIEVMAFLGTSPIRRYVEGWDLAHLLRLTRDAVEFAVGEGLEVTFVTEDTVRSRPDCLDPLFRAALDAGARRLCLCDTVGHVTPDGVRNLLEFTRDVIDSVGAQGIGIDWHGHNDRGLALTNALRAIEHGADRIHGTALGIGERVGNVPLDQLMVNLSLLGELEQDLSGLGAWCQAASAAIGAPIPRNYPVLGDDAFRTATGVHAAALVKARVKGDAWLEDRVYSGVPASLLGRHQHIDVGPMSGLSNVRSWLAAHEYPTDGATCEAVMAGAKRSDHVLSDAELHGLVAGLAAGARE